MNKAIQFTKSEGAGNDFIIIDNIEGDLNLTPEVVEYLCDRHFGIGADGLILAENSTGADSQFFMRYFNSDGSAAEMCGNGVRCYAKYIYDNCLIGEERFTISTLAGPKVVTLIFDDFEVTKVKVDMGQYSFSSPDLPVASDGGEFIDQEIDTGGERLRLTAVSMGNPHGVIFVPNIQDAPVLSVGPRLEVDPIFPNKTNVEFAEVVSDSLIKLRVFERGVGETLACGTGACATVVAANRLGLVGKKVTVKLLGGDLEIEIANDNIFMTGPANQIFTGQINLKLEDQS